MILEEREVTSQHYPLNTHISSVLMTLSKRVKGLSVNRFSKEGPSLMSDRVRNTPSLKCLFQAKTPSSGTFNTNIHDKKLRFAPLHSGKGQVSLVILRLIYHALLAGK